MSKKVDLKEVILKVGDTLEKKIESTRYKLASEMTKAKEYLTTPKYLMPIIIVCYEGGTGGSGGGAQA